MAAERATVVVDGDFTMALWGVTLDVEQDGRHETWMTGRHNEQAIDPEGTVAVADETWLYLHIKDGQLRIPALEAAPGSLVLTPQEGRMAVQGELHLHGARGELMGQVLDGNDVLVEGTHEAATSGMRGHRLALSLEGDTDAFMVDGQRVAVHPAGGGLPWLWSLLLVPVLAFAAWRWSRPLRVERHTTIDASWRPTTLRQRRGVGHSGLASDAMASRHLRIASKHAAKALKLYPRLPEAVLTRGIVLLTWLRLDEAGTALLDAWERLGAPKKRAIAGLYLARLHLIQKDQPGARYWVTEAYNLAPDLVAREIRRGAFDELDDSGLIGTIRRHPERAARMKQGWLDPSIV